MDNTALKVRVVQVEVLVTSMYNEVQVEVGVVCSHVQHVVCAVLIYKYAYDVNMYVFRNLNKYIL